MDNLDEDIILRLPVKYSYLSLDGKVFISIEKDIINIEFFTDRNIHYNRGYLYAKQRNIIDLGGKRETIILADEWFYEQCYD